MTTKTSKQSASDTKNTGKNVGSKNQVKVAEVEQKNKLTMDTIKKLNLNIFEGEPRAAEELADDYTFQKGSHNYYLYKCKNQNEATMLSALLRSKLMTACSDYGESISFEMLTTQVYKLIENFREWEGPSLKFEDYSLFFDDKFILDPHVLLRVDFPEDSEISVCLRDFLDILFNNQELISDYIAPYLNKYPEVESISDFILDFLEMAVVSSFREDIINQKFLYNYSGVDSKNKMNIVAFLLPQDIPSDELERKQKIDNIPLSTDKYLLSPYLMVKKYVVKYEGDRDFLPSLSVESTYLKI